MTVGRAESCMESRDDDFREAVVERDGDPVALWPCGEAPRLILPPVLGRAVNVGDLREPRCTEGLSTVQAGGQGNLNIGAVYTLPRRTRKAGGWHRTKDGRPCRNRTGTP
jgi:hypothetical protein